MPDGTIHLAVQALEPTTGALLWESVSVEGDMAITGNLRMVVAPDGSSLFVTKGLGDNTTRARYVTVAFDALTGKELWTADYDPPGSSVVAEPAGLAVSPGGRRVYVGGSVTRKGSFNRDYVTVSYDAVTGRQLWARYLDMGEDKSSDIIAAPERDRLYLSGNSYLFRSGRIARVVVAYRGSTGRRLWIARATSPGSDGGVLALSSDGTRVFAAGIQQQSARGAGLWPQVWALRVVGGKTVWINRGRSFPYSTAEAIAADPRKDRVFTTGLHLNRRTGLHAAITVAYRSGSRTPLWVTRFHLRKREVFPAAIATSPDGKRVYVTGSTTAGSGPSYRATDYVTIAYAPKDGRVIWSARFNTSPDGRDQDDAYDVAVAPGGEWIYVTGQKAPEFLGVTVAYAR